VTARPTYARAVEQNRAPADDVEGIA